MITRKPVDRPLGGICAGIADAVGVDVVFVVLAVVGLTMLAGLFFIPILYIILWLLLPIEGQPELEIGDRARVSFAEMRTKIRTQIDGLIDKVSQLRLNN